jgi:hypothetical protein
MRGREAAEQPLVFLQHPWTLRVSKLARLHSVSWARYPNAWILPHFPQEFISAPGVKS